MKALCTLACAIGLATSATPTAPISQSAIPSEFRHDRIFVVARAPDGSAVTFYTDSGGGYNALSSSVALRLGLTEHAEIDDDGEDSTFVEFPEFMETSGIPRPFVDNWLKGRLVSTKEAHEEADGFLGSRWFANRVWEIDYANATLRTLSDWKAIDLTARSAKLGFRIDADGKQDLYFPRITITVDDAEFEMLLDTGATAQLTETSSTAYGLPTGTKVGASYITKSSFDAWASKHPDWIVIDGAEGVTGRAYPMIKVPEITVAGQTVGPVWFTQRPDYNFRNWMSQMMDMPIEGALGGSGLKHFRVVVDYPGRAAYFWPAPGQDSHR